ncbi:MAG: phosphoribosyl-ATP diphosphatase [Methanoregula sp.]|nr:phosphoribosyl-ATP diphosphatase [Methanoregula sp.]
MTDTEVLGELFKVIDDRIVNPKPGSYVTSLVTDPKGIDKILEKVGEEATEFILAVKNGDPARTVEEAADLQFHLLVALRLARVDLSELMNELKKRRK